MLKDYWKVYIWFFKEKGERNRIFLCLVEIEFSRKYFILIKFFRLD